MKKHSQKQKIKPVRILKILKILFMFFLFVTVIHEDVISFVINILFSRLIILLVPRYQHISFNCYSVVSVPTAALVCLELNTVSLEVDPFSGNRLALSTSFSKAIDGKALSEAL